MVDNNIAAAMSDPETQRSPIARHHQGKILFDGRRDQAGIGALQFLLF